MSDKTLVTDSIRNPQSQTRNPASIRNRIGLMGGTFDPVHYGHLWVAEAAREAFLLDQVVWVPAGDPPHKEGALADQEHRYSMALLATATHPAFEVSRFELERTGPSYSLYTIQHFREQHAEAELFFIIGADAVLDLLTWYRHDEVMQLCRFIALARPGYDLERLKTVLPGEYLQRIEILDAPGIDLSSTIVRERVWREASIRYLVPEAVEAYIRKCGLYRTV